MFDSVIARLAETDARIRRNATPLSLAPDREFSTPLAQLGRQLLTPRVSPEVAGAFAEALACSAEAVLENFPANLFWDLDFLAASMLADAQRAGPRGVAQLGAAARLIVDLQKLFGRNSSIRFRYAHDFVYGFDWAKWVAREPRSRAAIGPFAIEFVRYLERRGHELLAMIAADDRKYPNLSPDLHRNPFAFSREPEEERQLHRELAERGLLPVMAWRADATPVWNRSYADLRAEIAKRLGIGSNQQSAAAAK